MLDTFIFKKLNINPEHLLYLKKYIYQLLSSNNNDLLIIEYLIGKYAK